MADFTYMGTKRLLAPRIATLVSAMADGPLLDLFSGIAAVGSEVAPTRSIWCNDVQKFSSLLTRRKFRSPRAFVTQKALIQAVTPIFSEHRAALANVFSANLAKENAALHDASFATLNEVSAWIGEVGRTSREQLRADGHSCLFSTTHAGTYFGLLQAIEIDSIRYAADQIFETSLGTEDEYEWMILALCQAISSSSNSTGHFAQYLTPNATNIHRVVRKRRRSIWTAWQTALLAMRPLGSVAWRRGNRVFNMDAVKLLDALVSKPRRPTVIYADPPYTSDQYSRYYHVLENLILYDYPVTAGKGQYRPDRFTSGFSLKSAVGKSFSELIEAASKIDAAFVLSYPTNGLLDRSTDQVLQLLRQNYAYVEEPVVIPHMHSTMGGSKGANKQAVDENIFIAYHHLRTRRRSSRPTSNGRSTVRPRARQAWATQLTGRAEV